MNNYSKFIYRGDVDVSVFSDKNKVIRKYNSHNNGTNKLFELFARAVGGETLITPKYIDIENNGVSLIKTKIFAVLKAQTVDINGQQMWATVITAGLRYTNIKSEASSITGDVDICLYDGQNNKYATSKVSSNILQITEGQQAVIEWKLYVQNEGV